ncbi:MAG: hypothetical protein LBF33_03250 [Oscillospiraceae bacterium]|jgi:hypothetical protein|nr:hypothetical protein [Oscillospiraceae bacterium]
MINLLKITAKLNITIISGRKCGVSALIFKLAKNMKTKQKSKVKIDEIETYITSKPNEE